MRPERIREVRLATGARKAPMDWYHTVPYRVEPRVVGRALRLTLALVESPPGTIEAFGYAICAPLASRLRAASEALALQSTQHA